MKKIEELRKKAPQGGFTLIEILIVIGIIAILAAIVLVAVNPARQFAQANNAQRSSNINAISSAIGQYAVDNKGDISGLSLPSTADDIGGGTGETDLCDLVPTYLPALPVDPLTEQTDGDLEDNDQSISETDCSQDYKTGYQVVEDDGRVTISALGAEGIDGATPDISVTR